MYLMVLVFLLLAEVAFFEVGFSSL